MTLHAFPTPSPDTAPLEVGFLTPHNALDRRTFSGTPFHAARALERQADINLRLIGNHRAPGRFDRLLRRTAQPGAFDHGDLDGLDLVVGMVATPLLDRLHKLRPDLPFLHVTDATPPFLRDVYGWAVPADADVLEYRVAQAAAACVYSSSNIAERAGEDLGIPGFAPASLPFGANFEEAPAPGPKTAPRDGIELLFVGIDWIRKGGDVAVAALDALRDQGVNARLSIVGRCPEGHKSHPAIRDMGFLDKNRPRDAEKLTALYREAHLLVLPTRADCAPMVIAEAMAHGTPVLVTDTGGIANQIGSDGAGRLLAPYARPGAWAAAIREMTRDADGYALLSDAARDRAEAVLSWDAWAEGITRLARQVAEDRGATVMPARATG